MASFSTSREETIKRLLQGAAVGALATLVIGFTWGGWVTGGTAQEMQRKGAASAVVSALAPICAEKFRAAGEATANLAGLKRANSWQQDTFIADGGWATFSGQKSPEPGVAQACANLLIGLS